MDGEDGKGLQLEKGLANSVEFLRLCLGYVVIISTVLTKKKAAICSEVASFSDWSKACSMWLASYYQ